MINTFSLHPAVRENHVTIADSIPGRGKIDPAKVRYFLINRHSPKRPLGFEFPNRIAKHFPQDEELFSRYLRSEQDAGVHQLTSQILDSVPGGLTINVQVNRGIVDTNRIHVSNAIRNILADGTPLSIKLELAFIHRKIMELIRFFVDRLPPETPIIDLHSMEPFSTPDQPPLSPETIPAYLKAYKTRVLDDTTRRRTDIMTGTKGQPPVADISTSNIIAQELEKAGINPAVNHPYDLGPIHGDYTTMLQRPGHVSAVDHLKTDLCKGSGEDCSFDTTHPIVDIGKIISMADIYKEILARALLAAA